MSSAVGSAVGKVARNAKSGQVLSKGAKRDPELYVLLGVMSAAFGLAGFYFGSKPTSASSEAKVSMAPNSRPWETDGKGGDYKYQYHPGGNPKNAPKNAPSALHSVVVPNVNLPKEYHEKYNKWGKDDW